MKNKKIISTAMLVLVSQYAFANSNIKLHMNLKDLSSNAIYEVKAGGIGGNEKTGTIYYDGLPGHRAALTIKRNKLNKTCYLENDQIVVRDFKHTLDTVSFTCETKDQIHNNIYWNNNTDFTNGAYSPALDLFYAAQMIYNMYEAWYGEPIWFSMFDSDPRPKRLVLLIHDKDTYFKNKYSKTWLASFDDGKEMQFPWSASFDMAAHTINLGFSLRRKFILSDSDDGIWSEEADDLSPIDIAFADMAAKAAEYYATGTNSWTIGSDYMKTKKALRYMNQPTLDCEGRSAGDNCSIENVKDYDADLKPSYISGIYNKVFYLMATSPGWNTKKAFDTMVQASLYYWHSAEDDDFLNVACGVMDGAQDYHYETISVVRAFAAVGIDATKCEKLS